MSEKIYILSDILNAAQAFAHLVAPGHWHRFDDLSMLVRRTEGVEQREALKLIMLLDQVHGLIYNESGKLRVRLVHNGRVLAEAA